eukprot:Amastigsp_a4834_13.p4 type:complete len:120 gc:universal Amastigsp_a4834_13:1165-806(-)
MTRKLSMAHVGPRHIRSPSPPCDLSPNTGLNEGESAATEGIGNGSQNLLVFISCPYTIESAMLSGSVASSSGNNDWTASTEADCCVPSRARYSDTKRPSSESHMERRIAASDASDCCEQ